MNLQRQIGIGTIPSSQERRAAVVPRINRLSNARQTDVSSSIGLNRILFVLASGGSFRTLRCTGGQEGRLSPGRTDPSASRPAPPRPAPPPRLSPPRPDRGMSGFGIRQMLQRWRYHVVRSVTSDLVSAMLPWLGWRASLLSNPPLFKSCLTQNSDIPRAGRHGAAHG